MDLTAVFDILNSVNASDDLWNDAFDLLQEHGLSWTLTSADVFSPVIDFSLVDLATQCICFPSV